MSTETQTDTVPLAPDRITPEHVKATVSGEYFYTFRGEPNPNAPAWHAEALGCLTLCILVLQNGWTVVGKSACVTPAAFDEEIGRKVARADAEEQIWALEGYVLKTHKFIESWAAKQAERDQSTPS